MNARTEGNKDGDSLERQATNLRIVRPGLLTMHTLV